MTNVSHLFKQQRLLERIKKQNAVVHYLQKTFYLKHRKLESKRNVERH